MGWVSYACGPLDLRVPPFRGLVRCGSLWVCVWALVRVRVLMSLMSTLELSMSTQGRPDHEYEYSRALWIMSMNTPIFQDQVDST